MKLKLDLNEKNIKEQFEENKQLLISLAIFGVSTLLFLIFILPNLLSFPGKWSERSVETEKLNQIKKAKMVLENAKVETLDSELETVNNALPSDKNFELILNAISQAAVKSNVVIKGYKFKGGPQPDQGVHGVSQALVFEISVEGGLPEAAKFIEELNRVFPISEAKKIEYSSEVSKVSAAFYFKPFTQVNAQDVALSREKNSEENNALKEISGWEILTPEILNEQLPIIEPSSEELQKAEATESASTL